MQTRRRFIQLGFAGAGVVAYGGDLFLVSGCAKLESAFAELESWEPTVLAAINGVIDVINPAAGSVLGLLVPKINAAWTAVTGAVTKYQANPNNTSVLNDLIDAMQAAESQFTAFIDAIGIPSSGVVSAAVAVLTLITTTLSAIAQKLAPTAPVPAPVAAARVRRATKPPLVISGVTLNIQPVYSGKAFKKQVNSYWELAGRPDKKI